MCALILEVEQSRPVAVGIETSPGWQLTLVTKAALSVGLYTSDACPPSVRQVPVAYDLVCPDH